MEENFLLLFRFDNPLDSSVEFMKVTDPELKRVIKEVGAVAESSKALLERKIKHKIEIPGFAPSQGKF